MSLTAQELSVHTSVPLNPSITLQKNLQEQTLRQFNRYISFSSFNQTRYSLVLNGLLYDRMQRRANVRCFLIFYYLFLLHVSLASSSGINKYWVSRVRCIWLLIALSFAFLFSIIRTLENSNSYLQAMRSVRLKWNSMHFIQKISHQNKANT